MNLSRTILVSSLALAGLALGPAAVAAAAGAGVPALRPGATNASASAVVRPPRRLEEEELRQLLTDFLNEGSSKNGADWEVRITRLWTPLPVPEGPLTVEIIEPNINRITSNTILRVEIRAGRQLLATRQVPVYIRLWRKVLIAETTLRRGQLLCDVALTLERRDVLTLRDPLYELPSAAAAYELAESVPVGAPLTARAFRVKPVVFRGKTVTAIMTDNALTISLKVEVLEEGVPGQLVRVRNLQSRRELRGKVQDEQTILISL